MEKMAVLVSYQILHHTYKFLRRPLQNVNEKWPDSRFCGAHDGNFTFSAFLNLNVVPTNSVPVRPLCTIWTNWIIMNWLIESYIFKWHWCRYRVCRKSLLASFLEYLVQVETNMLGEWLWWPVTLPLPLIMLRYHFQTLFLGRAFVHNLREIYKIPYKLSFWQYLIWDTASLRTSSSLMHFPCSFCRH